MKGIIISGAKSGVGKTTITMAIMKALENVAPFKIGPDFIDPKFHEYATKNKSYNLDAFLLGEEIVKELSKKDFEFRNSYKNREEIFEFLKTLLISVVLCFRS